MKVFREIDDLDAVGQVQGILQTPVGEMMARASERGVQELRFTTIPPQPLVEASKSLAWITAPKGAGRAFQHLELMRSELAEYFDGVRTSFQVGLDLEGTPFQKRVWHELVQIEWGTTIAYRELASRIGRPSAVRAVAQANARNPVCMVVPCHRVIAHDGSLSGYAGGPWRKRWMLDLESKKRGLQ